MAFENMKHLRQQAEATASAKMIAELQQQFPKDGPGEHCHMMPTCNVQSIDACAMDQACCDDGGAMCLLGAVAVVHIMWPCAY